MIKHSAPVKQGAFTKPAISENAIKLIDRMFARMKSIFPAWKQAFDNVEDYNATKQVWLEELLKADVVTPAKLKRGLDLAAKSGSPFFPSVGQFVEWCNTETYTDLGLPTAKELRQEINKFMAYGMSEVEHFNFRSNAEYWLITQLYINNRNQKWDDERLNREIIKALDAMAERIANGEAIPAPKKQLPQEVKKPATEETIRNHIANWKAMFGRRVAHRVMCLTR